MLYRWRNSKNKARNSKQIQKFKSQVPNFEHWSLEIVSCFEFRISNLTIGILPPFIHTEKHHDHLCSIEWRSRTHIPRRIVTTQNTMIGSDLHHFMKPASGRIIGKCRSLPDGLLPKCAANKCGSFGSADGIPRADFTRSGTKAIVISFHPPLPRCFLQIRKEPVPRGNIRKMRIGRSLHKDSPVELDDEFHKFRSRRSVPTTEARLRSIQVLFLHKVLHRIFVPRSGRNIGERVAFCGREQREKENKKCNNESGECAHGREAYHMVRVVGARSCNTSVSLVVARVSDPRNTARRAVPPPTQHEVCVVSYPRHDRKNRCSRCGIHCSRKRAV